MLIVLRVDFNVRFESPQDPGEYSVGGGDTSVARKVVGRFVVSDHSFVSLKKVPNHVYFFLSLATMSGAVVGTVAG